MLLGWAAVRECNWVSDRPKIMLVCTFGMTDDSPLAEIL